MRRHGMEPYPVPKEKAPLYVNEPWLADVLLLDYFDLGIETNSEDNIRVYVPLDLNSKAILRRLDYVINRYGEFTEKMYSILARMLI